MADLSLRADSVRINPVAIFGRKAVEDEVERLIALLDAADADVDLEPDNDDQDGDWAEDEPSAWLGVAHGPGCPVADPGGCEHDGRELYGAEFRMEGWDVPVIAIN